jgi:hypothetical protein
MRIGLIASGRSDSAGRAWIMLAAVAATIGAE